MKEPRIPYVTKNRFHAVPSVQMDLTLLEEQATIVNKLERQLEEARLARNRTIWRLIARAPRTQIARLAGMSQQALYKIINSSERFKDYTEE